MAFKLPNAVRPLWDFAVHIVIGAIGFCALLLVAVAVSGFVRFIEWLGWGDSWTLSNAHTAEHVIFGLDLFGFGLFLLSELIRLVVKLWTRETTDV